VKCPFDVEEERRSKLREKRGRGKKMGLFVRYWKPLKNS
jgi:hypothetical protein